jgi:spermidine/putrescine transport system ATP-binding protein
VALTYALEFKDVSKSYNENIAVDSISFTVNKGEFFSLLGPSGCGKTTTLRLVAGLEEPTSGDIFIDGKNVNDLEPHLRPVNTVFQSYSLFPHLSVKENIIFGLKIRKFDEKEIEERLEEVISLIDLKEYLKRKPHQLSGGQQQRVAIARALINKPDVLLMDEPLGALDLKLRERLQVEIKAIQESLKITTIYVTHDQNEALAMSDKIAVMNKGKILQLDDPEKLYEKPSDPFVANFLGNSNVFEGTIENNIFNSANLKNIKVDSTLSGNAFLILRPEIISFDIEPSTEDDRNSVAGVVEHILYRGSWVDILVNVNGVKLEISKENNFQIALPGEGEKLYLSWNIKKAWVLDGED